MSQPQQPRKCRLSVFASGQGSNLQALLDHQHKHPEWPAEIVLVVSDKPDCAAVERARRAGIPVFARVVKAYPDKAAFETDVLGQLKEYKVDWLVLAGYMRLVGPVLLQAYPNRIVNIHPSLLPAFPGRHAVRDALAAGAAETGVTVHFVDDGIDTGPVIAQERVTIDPGMSEDALLERIHAVEHRLYPRVIADITARWLAQYNV